VGGPGQATVGKRRGGATRSGQHRGALLLPLSRMAKSRVSFVGGKQRTGAMYIPSLPDMYYVGGPVG